MGLGDRRTWCRTLSMDCGVDAEGGADDRKRVGVFLRTGGVCSSDRAAALLRRFIRLQNNHGFSSNCLTGLVWVSSSNPEYSLIILSLVSLILPEKIMKYYLMHKAKMMGTVKKQKNNTVQQKVKITYYF